MQRRVAIIVHRVDFGAGVVKQILNYFEVASYGSLVRRRQIVFILQVNVRSEGKKQLGDFTDISRNSIVERGVAVESASCMNVRVRWHLEF